jgi:uncharacterized protein YndB with AHSA1/START domain
LLDDPLVERTVELPASVEEVWAALTEPDRLSAWVGGRVVELECRPGGRGLVRRDDGAVRRLAVEAVDPVRRLVLRWWPFEDGMSAPGGRGTTVEFLIEPAGDGCLLRVLERAPLILPGTARAGTARAGTAITTITTVPDATSSSDPPSSGRPRLRAAVG